MKFKSIFISILLFASISSFSFAQEAEANSKSTKVFIMPLTSHVENYNFSLDRERLRLVSMFSSLGFDVIDNESTWENVSELDYDLVNLSEEMLNNLSEVVDADVIVYRVLNNIRVFDCNKKSFVNFDMDLPYTNSQFVAYKLKQAGY